MFTASGPSILLLFDERFAMVVDGEYWSRHNNRLKRNIYQAAFDQPLIEALGTCGHIRERHNVIVMGATGSGKTYIGCALGMAVMHNLAAVIAQKMIPAITARDAGSDHRNVGSQVQDTWLPKAEHSFYII